MKTSNLKDKAVNGLKWSLIDNVANSGITFLVGIVLARLLSPAEFGILGLITIFINLSNTIVDGGFVTALIRKPHSNNDDYNTVFYSNLIVSFGLMLLLIIFSPQLASFFNQTVLGQIMPVMSILLLINAFAIIQRTLLVKQIDFKTQAKISLIASLGSGFIGIGMAIAGFGVWSLVWQQLSRQSLMTLFLWIYGRWRPSWAFSVASFKDLFGFGFKVLVANLINSLYKDMFLAVIGKMYSVQDLGQYNRADQFNLVFTNNLTMVIQKVSMPALSQIQDDKDKLRFAFRKTIIYSSIITFALVFSLAAVAKPLVILLVGEQWMPAIEYLQIMCLYGALYPVQNLNINLMNIVKRSDLLLKLEVIKKNLFIPVIVTGFYFELKYMIWAAVAYYYIEFLLNSWYSKQLVGYGTWDQVKDLLPILSLSIMISAIIWLCTLLALPYWLMLSIQICVAIISYVAAYEIWDILEYRELKQIVIQQLTRKQK